MKYLQSIHTTITDANYNLPMIGYKSNCTLSDYTSLTTDSNYPPSNLWTPDTYTVWRDGQDNGSIILLNASHKFFDYVGIAGHNFYSAGISVRLRVANSSGGPWATLMDYTAVADASPFFIALNPTNTLSGTTGSNTYAYISLDFQQSGATRAQISHIKIGAMLRLPYKVFVNVKPSILATMVTNEVQIAENGNYLGRIVKSSSRDAEIKQDHNTQAFVWNSVKPFLDHCQKIAIDDGTPQETFFYLPRPADNPTGQSTASLQIFDIIYGWAKSINYPQNHMSNGLMTWGVNVKGLA